MIEVVERRRQRPPVALFADGDERIGSDRGDLEEDEGVECVTRRHQSEQARLAQQKARLHQACASQRGPPPPARDRNRCAAMTPTARDISRAIIAPRPSIWKAIPSGGAKPPICSRQRPGARPHRKGKRHPRREDGACDARSSSWCARWAQRRGARSHQRTDHQQHGRVRRKGRRGGVEGFETSFTLVGPGWVGPRPGSTASISSASTVPNASRTRTAMARPTASVATPRRWPSGSRTWGSGFE